MSDNIRWHRICRTAVEWVDGGGSARPARSGVTKGSLVEKIASNSTRGILYILISAVCFSLAGVLIKLIPWSALAISGSRSIFAAVVLYVFLRMKGGRLVVNGPNLFGAAINFAMLQTFILANTLTTAANAIVLQFTLPVWIILIGWVVYRQRPGRSEVVASIVIVAGIACFFLDRLGGGTMIGNIVAIISGIAYAGVFYIKRIPGCDFECSAILSLLACTLVGIPDILHASPVTPGIVAAVVVLGVVQLGLAYVFLSKGLDSVSPIAASLTSMLEPVLNPIIVAITVGETIGPISLVGAALVLGGSCAYNVHNALAQQRMLDKVAAGGDVG